MSDTTPEAKAGAAPEAITEAKGHDSIWPIVAIYAFMWAGMIGTSLNTDAIKADYSPAVILGFAIVLAIVIYFAAARLRRQTLFGFGHSTILGNLAWHVFIVTGIVFICYLFFLSVVQIMVLSFGAPIFEAGCDKISQRDTALFVWEAMAKGAFKVFANYLPLPAEACAPATSWAATNHRPMRPLVHGAGGGLVRRQLRQGLVSARAGARRRHGRLAPGNTLSSSGSSRGSRPLRAHYACWSRVSSSLRGRAPPRVGSSA